MLGKLFQKSNNPSPSQHSSTQETAPNVAFHVSVHYGIPSTASNLAYDPIQHLVAIGTLDGRIKVIGGDNVEGLLMSPKSMPFKHLEFLQNQGFLVSVTNENEIQVWDLENRCISSNLLWESHITAFSVIYGTQFMYVGDEYGFLSVLKYDAEEGKLHHLPYHIPANVLAETEDVSFSHDQSIVGVFAQPSSSGNRVLIAYEHGLIVLWNVTEDRAVLVRGCKDLELKDETLTGNPNDGVHGHGDDLFDHEQEGKEISSLCWLSADGSLLAVGYVDGDILIWNLSVSDTGTDDPTLKSSNKVIKLQLSSGERRLPVIVLHWSPNKAQNDCRGQLFVYGGEEIGSEEVLTVLDLDWSSGIATVKCVHRVDLPLSGSFADMIVMGTSHDLEQKGAASLLILTNPGQLLYYDNASLSTLKADPDKKHSVPAVQYPATVPTVEPHLTVGKLHSVVTSGDKFLALAETVPAVKNSQTRGRERWPLTGGVPYQPSRTEDKGIKRIYIAGYQDGTVRVWDATFPVLSLILVFQVEVKGIEIPGVNAPISTLEFSSTSSALAIGNEFGLVCIYFLDQNSDKSSLTIVMQTQREVHNLPSQNGPHCTAIFSLVNSPVHCLHWVSPGRKLAVGFGCGQVAMLDITSMSVLYLTDIMSGSSIISFAVKTLPDEIDSSKNQTESGSSNEPLKEVAVILTRDAHIILMDVTTGKTIHQPMHPKEASAITLCFLDENASVAEGSEEDLQLQTPSQDVEGKSQLAEESDWVAVGGHKHSKSMNTTILLCCEKKLRLYSLNSVIQGNLKAVSKLKLLKPCVWTTVFKKDTTGHGLIIVYQSGEIEIRSLPDFAVLGSTSLMSLLRWNARTNMEKKMSSEKGNLTLVHGSEFAILSLSAFENDFRIPEALPCLHDKVLAAAAEAAVNSHHHKNKQNVLGGLIKGLKGNKKDANNSDAGKHVVAHLDDIFSRFPFSDPLKNGPHDQGIIELNIDDINIDEPAPLPSPSVTTKVDKKDKGTEREKLFEGGSSDTKPRTRTREEIIAKYRKTGDATSAASQAKDKLLERQEKLEKLSQRTEELSSGAENFASLAQELAKTMERRNKWWKI